MLEARQQLNPRIKSVWRINDAIWIAVSFLCCFLPFAIIALVAPEEAWAGVVALIVAIVFAALLVLCVVVLPPIRYARWRYELTPDYLDIARGIFWRKRFVIPFIRVQNTDTRQGPILRALRAVQRHRGHSRRRTRDSRPRHRRGRRAARPCRRAGASGPRGRLNERAERAPAGARAHAEPAGPGARADAPCGGCPID